MRAVVAAAAAAAVALGPLVAAQAGTFVNVGNTLVSAMMIFLGNEGKVYILDKAENNPTTIDGHPAWAAVWDIETSSATPMNALTNSFCASGMHLPNGSYAVFGGNGPVGPGGVDTPNGGLDPNFQDYDGRRAIRILNPCTGSANSFGPQCAWFDNSSLLAMNKERWYPGTEPLSDGSVVLIGGAVRGGYVNRVLPDTDPGVEGGLAEPTYEFYPAQGTPQVMQLMITTSGLNLYAHTYLMPSGLMLVQSGLKTVLWDYYENNETPLPDMPGGVFRVYPASGATAMMPLTPANSYTPTILFCGGATLSGDQWGTYSQPHVDTWTIPASNDCHRLTPEPLDVEAAVDYEQDDDMLQARTMGQFTLLPDGTMLLINGGSMGTAGYSAIGTPNTPWADMPFGMGLAAAPTFKPAIYNPLAPAGQRWSDDGLQASTIARLYHSTALLLPDASVIVCGSNPNADYNVSTPFPTEYRAEIFYPPYWGGVRPVPTGIPASLSYGGPSFDVSFPASSYNGTANDAAANATAVVIRTGFVTHAMSMGQRFLQLNNTYTVGNDGTVTLHVSQVPPNPHLITPGPVLFFVVVNGIPSVGQMVIVGTGSVGQQPILDVADLPPSVLATATTTDGGGSTSTGPPTGNATSTKKSSSLGIVIGGIAGGVLLFAVIGVGVVVLVRRRPPPSAAARRATAAQEAEWTRPGTGLLSDSHAALAAPSARFGTGHASSAASSALWADDGAGMRERERARGSFESGARFARDESVGSTRARTMSAGRAPMSDSAYLSPPPFARGAGSADGRSRSSYDYSASSGRGSSYAPSAVRPPASQLAREAYARHGGS